MINNKEKKPGFIFTVFENNKNNTENKVNHYLIKEEIPHKVVTISNTHEGEKKEILGFYLDTNEKYDFHNLYDFVRSQCTIANQTSFLQLSVDREVEFMPLKGNPKGMGKLTAVNEKEAMNATDYIYCPKLEVYYICK